MTNTTALPSRRPEGGNTWATFAHAQLASVLRLVELECDGRRVEVDGYRWAPDGRPDGPPFRLAELCPKGVYSQDVSRPASRDGHVRWWTNRPDIDELDGYAAAEPRLWTVRDVLQFYLAHGTFLKAGRPVTVTGFRLIKPIWQTDGHSILSTLGSFGAACNCSCKFCYEYGNILFSRYGLLTYAEARERLMYYNPNTGEGIIPVLRRYGEPTINPDFLRILAEMRRVSPDEVLFFVTNGSMLTEPVVKELRRLQRVQMSLSINTVDVARRKDLMGFPTLRLAEQGIRAAELLYRHGVRYESTIVTWPPLDFDMLERAVEYLWQNHTMVITFSLPSYSRHFPSHAVPFRDEDDIFEIWDRLCDWIQEMRRRYTLPILHHPVRDLTAAPRIEGVLRHSPAERAGVLPGDVIHSVNGERVFHVPSAKDKLVAACRSHDEATLTVLRDGQLRDLLLSHDGYSNDDDGYPYKLPDEGIIPEYCFGAEMRSGFDLADITALAEMIEQENAQEVLLCSSEPVIHVALEAIKLMRTHLPVLARVNLYVSVPEHRWWGGSFVVGDLYMVEDYAGAIQDFIDAHGCKPDLVILPRTFGNRWGMDLAGQSAYTLGRRFDLRVRLLDCQKYM